MKQIRDGTMNELVALVFGGRYVIFLMGFFAMYCGYIYNDCFSNPLNLFGTRWVEHEDADHEYLVQESIYPFGVDPAWFNRESSLAFFNSLKMKLAVIIGVTQMIFGVMLGWTNAVFFKDKLSVFFETIPRLVFLSCTFGYMIIIIIVKWCMEWPNTSTAPNLITVMIDMFLSPGNITEDTFLYEGQATVQVICLSLALISVPLMLFVIPCVTKHRHQQGDHAPIAAHDAGPAQYSRLDIQQEKKQELFSPSDEVPCMFNPNDHTGHGTYVFSDHMIVQGIHTIEYVLGCVSNTASYLRLWALSLAHAELAEVFWEKLIMNYGLEMNNFVVLIVSTFMWCMATLFVLLLMDVLECFLHALRLHWVEFQNKFYHADGYAFTPFAFPTFDPDLTGQSKTIYQIHLKAF